MQILVGADINKKNVIGNTPLLAAAKNGHVGILKLLTRDVSGYNFFIILFRNLSFLFYCQFGISLFGYWLYV